MKYKYPAYFKPVGEGNYEVTFPDIEDCFTFGEDLDDAIFMADDVLNLVLTVKEEGHEEIPPASNIEDLHPADGIIVKYIEADTTAYAKLLEEINNKPVSKHVTIPEWLNIEAKNRNINFSKVLQNALKKELGLELNA